MPVIDDRLEVGAIIYEFVHDTTPPKHKYYIIIGYTEDKVALGTVYINSHVNRYFESHPDLLPLHLPILQNDYPFLKRDSHIDCSHVEVRDTSDVQACLSGDPTRYGYCSTISSKELIAIREAIDKARTIPPIIKKKFGIRP